MQRGIRSRRVRWALLGFAGLALAVPAASSARSLSINDGFAVETDAAGGRLTFAIKLSKASTKDVTVRVRTKDGSATSPDDYASKADTLKFKPGDVKKKIHINITGDDVAETNETFTARLYNAKAANVGRSRGTGTIVEDDTTGEAEVNNSPGTANIYSFVNPLYAGAIDPLGDVDYYSFTLGAGGNVSIQTFDHGASRCADLTDTQLTLYASDGTTQLGTNDDGGDGLCSLISNKPLTVGTYYVKVESAVGTDIFEYALGIAFS
jgi:hypothetical protein